MEQELTSRLTAIDLAIRETLQQNDIQKQPIGLTNGLSGLCMFYAYYHKVIPTSENKEMVTFLLESIFDNISQAANINTSFASGLSGVGWLIEHLFQEELADIDTNEVLSEFDESLFKIAIANIHPQNYDFLHGFSGVLFYYLSRYRSSGNIKQAEHYIHQLYDNVAGSEQAAGWNFFDRSLQETIPGYYNLGLAHGMPSIQMILCYSLQLGICKELCSELLQHSSRFVSGYCNTVGSSLLSLFPSDVKDNIAPKYNSRLAWCYGDPGIAISLWNSGRGLNDAILEELAGKVFLHSANRRDLKENHLYDACVCHGTAGIAQIMLRYHEQTQHPSLLDTANFWLEQTLKMAYHKDGVAGFKFYHPEEALENNNYFLSGTAGIGLTLLSFISKKPLNWDKALLISI